MTKTLALLHTTAVTVPTMKELAAQHLPGVRVINLLDDSLLADVMAADGVTEAVEQRLATYVVAAAEAGAEGLMVCCSSVGEVAERLRATASIPVMRVDEPMAEEAVRLADGGRVGVIATVRTTLEPTANLVRRKASELGRPVEVEAVLVDGAFAALSAGRGDEHDKLVLAALLALLERVSVVVLAQASMARLLGTLAAPPRVPVLVSPVSGLKAAGAAVTAGA